jgi:hypothetical protein
MIGISPPMLSIGQIRMLLTHMAKDTRRLLINCARIGYNPKNDLAPLIRRWGRDT